MEKNFINPTFTKSLFSKLLNDTNPVVFLDISVEGKIYRLYFELFAHKLPKTCENFRIFCTGESIKNNKPQGYKNTKFHRLIKSFMLQGGDFVHFDGTGDTSIYGSTFEDEGFYFSHCDIGCLSMANSGKNTNGCQFFITLDKCEYLDKEHVMFGRIIDDFSKDVLKNIINEIPSTFQDDEPLKEIKLVECGQM